MEWTVKSVDGVDINETPTAQEKEQAVVAEAAAENPNIEIANDSDVIKVDLSNPPKQETNAGNAQEEIADDEKEIADEKEITHEENGQITHDEEKGNDEEEAVIELITDEEPTPVVEVATEETPASVETPQPVLPEGVDKLVQFMEETGGTLQDYINLNKSYDDLHPVDVIKEHYKQTKPHLDDSEIEFLMEEKFSYDQDNDDPREIKRKQLAFKEELYDAKKSLTANKDKYYSDLKLNRNLNPEEREAIDFYQQHKQSQEDIQKQAQAFTAKTDQLFNDEFKGFDFKVGDNKYRFKVNDVAGTKNYQSDLNNFIGDFVGDSGAIEDVAGYHKALFAAKNADKIAQHFYEQGRADALKTSAKESKNIDMSPKGDAGSVVSTKTGTQFRVVSGQSSNGLKFKMRK